MCDDDKRDDKEETEDCGCGSNDDCPKGNECCKENCQKNCEN